MDALKRDEILETAKSIINGEREGTYGKAEDSFKTIAALWKRISESRYFFHRCSESYDSYEGRS